MSGSSEGWPLVGAGGSRTGGRSRAIQPRRAGNSERHRAPGICRAGPAPRDLEDPQTGAGGPCRSWGSLGNRYERRRAAHALPIFADLVANRGRLFGMPQHYALGGEEFLLRISGSARGQAPGAVRGVCLHAALRRHRDDVKLPAYERRQRLEAWLDAFHRAEVGTPDRRSRAAGSDRYAAALQDSGRTARPVGLWHRHGHPGKCRKSLASETDFKFSTAPSAICASIAIGWPPWWAWSASGFLVIAILRPKRWRRIWAWRFS